MWIFIFGDMLVFSAFFVTYIYARHENAGLFRDSQAHLNQAFGGLNTLFMLSSSWFVAMGVHSARRNMGKLTPLCFGAAFACGTGFGLVKILEYSEKIRAGITVNTNDFYMYYYIFTGIHFGHVLLAMAVMAFMVRYSWSTELPASKVRHLETGASFWHVVDLLWIVLFALLYLVR